MMNALIIEDEELAARNLTNILKEIGNINTIAILESIADTVEWFEVNDLPDLVFMDIHLADGSAFEIFKMIRIDCPIIFTTAYDEYALQAFKVNSIDYLLKPITLADVKKTLDKQKIVSGNHTESADLSKLLAMIRPTAEYKTHFLVSQKGDKLVPLKTSEIAYVSIETSVVRAIDYKGKTFVMENTLDELAGMLDPKEFFRANRQFIIARNAIKDIDLWFNGRLSVNLIISTPEKVLISKVRIPVFKDWFA
jgi:two-component system LytT family response regulator